MSESEKTTQKIAADYGIELRSCWTSNDGLLKFGTPAMPVLTFFFELCNELRVPFDSVRLSHTSIDQGCPTCGGASVDEFDWEIDLSQDLSNTTGDNHV